MIIEQLTNMKNSLNDNLGEGMDVPETLAKVIRRYEKLCEDVCAAAAIDGNDRVADIVEEELEE